MDLFAASALPLQYKGWKVDNNFIVWTLLSSPFVAVVTLILWDARRQGERVLRLPNETLPVAIREWFKAIGFLAASGAATLRSGSLILRQDSINSRENPMSGANARTSCSQGQLSTTLNQEKFQSLNRK